LTMPITVWFATIFGPTRIIIVPSLALALVSFLIPFANQYETLLVLHAVMGLCLGTYLPLTISLALGSLKPQYWLFGMAAYSLRVSVGMDFGVSVSGLYTDVLDWHWVYWTAAIVAPVIAFMAWKALPLTPIDRQKLSTSDWGGMAMFCLGLALVSVGFSQGELLGWFDSGLVASCLIGGVVLFVLAVVNIALNQDAFVDLAGLSNHNVRIALLI